MAAVDVKLVLLGHKNVGKTAIFNRYVYDEFGRTSMVPTSHLTPRDSQQQPAPSPHRTVQH